jgi:hypothetical protein
MGDLFDRNPHGGGGGGRGGDGGGDDDDDDDDDAGEVTNDDDVLLNRGGECLICIIRVCQKRALPHTHSLIFPSLLVRAGHTSRNPGNVRHNELVLHGVIEWLSDHASDGPSWAQTAERIRAEIRLAGGRYLRWNPLTGAWTELGEEATLKTIDQAMRSRLQWIRKLDSDRPALRMVDSIRANDFKRGRGGQ